MTYLEWLIAEIKKITSEDLGIFCPTQEIKDGETVIGELTEDERKISAYLDKNGTQMLSEMDEKDDDDLTDEELKKLKNKGDEFLLIKEVFWKSVDDRLKSQGIDTGSIAIRKDWKIVSLPEGPTILSVSRMFSSSL